MAEQHAHGLGVESGLDAAGSEAMAQHHPRHQHNLLHRAQAIAHVQFLQHEVLQIPFGDARGIPEGRKDVGVKQSLVSSKRGLLHESLFVDLPLKCEFAECDYIVLKLVASFL